MTSGAGRVLSAVLIVALAYVGWSWASGRLAAGAVGLLHPVGQYWATKPVHPRCVGATVGSRELELHVVTSSGESLGQPTVDEVTGDRITLSYARSVDVMPHNAPTGASEGTVEVPLGRAYEGQRVEVSGKVVPVCPH